MYLLIPMSGQGNRFKDKGFAEPKPLIPVNGEPIIQRLLQCFPLHWKAVFVLAENHKETGLEEVLKKLRPDAKIIYVEQHKYGPSFAALKGLEVIPPNEPVLVSYCDYGMVWDPYQFEKFVQETACDSCLVSYRGFHPHYLSPTMYAYSRLENDNVVEVKEKGSFTANRENEFASNGTYYFRQASVLKKAIDYQIENKIQLNGEYYTSLTVQALIQMQPQSLVKVFEIAYFFQWGTPEDLQYFEYWENTFKNYNRFSTHDQSYTVDQVLMPMAGAGSRFGALTKTAKPLIPINDRPMYKWALYSLPKAKKNHFVVGSSFSAEVNEDKKDLTILDKMTEGQAITTGLGLESLEAGKDIVVSSCDHAIVLDSAKWKNFKNLKNIDAAIFVIKNFPGTLRSPNSYAYVEVDQADASDFKKVKNVSVKKPVSDKPSNDFLLVGTFWFKNKDIAEKGIKAVVDKNIRVNNEFYLDSVFTELLAQGLTVVTIPLDGYINLGDPSSLSEALYWHECFSGFKLAPRQAFQGVKL